MYGNRVNLPGQNFHKRKKERTGFKGFFSNFFVGVNLRVVGRTLCDGERPRRSSLDTVQNVKDTVLYVTYVQLRQNDDANPQKMHLANDEGTSKTS